MNKGTLIPVTFAVLLTLLVYSFVKTPKNRPLTNERIKVEKEDALLWAKARNYYTALPELEDLDPIEKEKVKLGQLLYFDTRLSINNEQSCNSCHDLATYGVDNKSTSPGALPGTKGDRNSPTVLNAVFHKAQFWDSRAADLTEQAKGPILNPVEMAMPHEHLVVERLQNVKEYVKRFTKAFPGQNDPITYDNVASAIASFEKRLVTPAKFDAFISLDLEAFNAQEKRGLKMFLDAGCQSCHDGVAFGGQQERRFGEMVDFKSVNPKINGDQGVFNLTGNPGDMYKFKVPSLRNIDKTYPYFHDGSIGSLDESVWIMGKTQLNKEFTPEEISDLIAFLKTLTGEVPKDLRKAPDLPK